jgi:hypothetical protein
VGSASEKGTFGLASGTEEPKFIAHRESHEPSVWRETSICDEPSTAVFAVADLSYDADFRLYNG